MTAAVIFLPTAMHIAQFGNQCARHCTWKGYDVAGVTANWRAVTDMITSREAGVIVAARFEHLNPDREPRTEIASGLEGADTAQLLSRHRRPRRV